MRKNLLRGVSFCLLLLLVTGVLLLSPMLRPNIHAQRADLFAAAARYPKFTHAQRMSVLRQRQFELHPTWKDLSLTEAAQRLFKFATQAVSPSQPSLANFLGNTTSINSPSGTALALTRQSNCSLDFLYGTFAASFSNPGFTITNTTQNYEQVLHSAAGLTTTEDKFSNGCAEATQGLTARRSVYVGKTSGGLNVFGSYVYNAAAGETLVYSVVTDSSFAYKSSAALANGALPVAVLTSDLNKDGIGDLASINNAISAVNAPTVSVFLGNADGSFKSATDVSLAGSRVVSAVIDDFNNDGIMDIVASTETYPSVGSTVTYQLNFLAGKGDGTFAADQSVTVTSPGNTLTPYQALTSASLRGNGTKDLITSSGIVLLGKGDGTFTQSSTPAFPILAATSSFGPNLAAADFNKDGKIDLAVDDGQTINIYNGKGDGTFTVGSAYGSIDNVGYLTASDLDGDGNIDLYSGQANGGVFGGDQFEVNEAYALMGNGDGTFAGAPATPFAFTGTNLGDLNGDGKLDGVGVNAILTSADISFTSYLGKGDGTFQSKSTLAVSPATVQGTAYTFSAMDSFALGDFNGDGKTDLLYFPKQFYGPNGATGYFLALGDGSGNFAAPVFTQAPSFVSAGDHDNAEQLSSVLVADFNHDGKLDIIYNYYDQGVTSGTFYQGIAVQLGNGDGTFKAPQTIQTYSGTTLPSVPQPLVVQTGDTNQDAKPDIFVLVTKVVPSGVATQLELYLGNGDGTFGSPSTPSVADQINPPSFGSALGQIVLADVNDDGHADLVTLGTTTDDKLGELAVSLGKGDGTFAAPKILNFGGGSSLGYGLAVGDFDGDGKLDAFVGGFTPPFDTGIFLGNGDGTFQTFSNSNGVVQPIEAIDLLVWGPAYATDFNGDGKEDVLGGDAVLLNRGVASTPPSTGSAATTTALSAAPTSAVTGTSVALIATVTSGTGSPTGAVTFLDGVAPLATGTLSSGTASFSTTSLAVGPHAITASYAGDPTHLASVSSAVTVTITAPPPPPAPSFTMSLTPASGSVAPAGSTTTSITITPSNGFNQAVSFACSGLPAQATCAFAPATVTPGATAATTVLTITTTASASVATPAGPNGKLPFAFAGVLLGLAFLRDRRRMRSWLLSCIAFCIVGVGLLGLGSCSSGSGGGGGGSPTSSTGNTTPTPTPTTSTVTLKATGGSISQTATYTLTVQ